MKHHLESYFRNGKTFQKKKKKNIKVVLNGQGVDEIFGGYNIYYQKQDLNKTYPDGLFF